jgi:hypothetical protein
MPFFDFYRQPTLQCLFSEHNAATGTKKLSPWIPLDKDKIPFLMKCCKEFPFIVQSQGNLTQLTDANCNLVCTTLYIPEKDMLIDDLIQGSTVGPLGVYLQKDKITEIINGNPYEILKTDDWTTRTYTAKFAIPGKQVKPLKTKTGETLF